MDYNFNNEYPYPWPSSNAYLSNGGTPVQPGPTAFPHNNSLQNGTAFPPMYHGQSIAHTHHPPPPPPPPPPSFNISQQATTPGPFGGTPMYPGIRYGGNMFPFPMNTSFPSGLSPLQPPLQSSTPQSSQASNVNSAHRDIDVDTSGSEAGSVTSKVPKSDSFSDAIAEKVSSILSNEVLKTAISKMSINPSSSSTSVISASCHDTASVTSGRESSSLDVPQFSDEDDVGNSTLQADVRNAIDHLETSKSDMETNVPQVFHGMYF